MSQSTAGGLFLTALGALALWLGRDLSTGTLGDIGAGFFPRLAAIALVLHGLVLIVLARREAASEAVPVERWSARSLVAILGAILVFGVTIRGFDFGFLTVPPLGIVLAAPIAILFASFADPTTRPREIALFAVALTVFCALLFRFVLGLPIPLAPWLVGY